MAPSPAGGPIVAAESVGDVKPAGAEFELPRVVAPLLGDGVEGGWSGLEVRHLALVEVVLSVLACVVGEEGFVVVVMAWEETQEG